MGSPPNYHGGPGYNNSSCRSNYLIVCGHIYTFRRKPQKKNVQAKSGGGRQKQTSSRIIITNPHNLTTPKDQTRRQGLLGTRQAVF